MVGTSVDGLERMGALGRFSTDGNGAVTNTVVDVTNAAESPQNIPFTATIAFDATTNIAAGRGNFTIEITGLGLVDFTFYMVDHQRMFIQVGEETNPNLPIMAGLIVRQADGTFSDASLEDESVFYMQGVMRFKIAKGHRCRRIVILHDKSSVLRIVELEPRDGRQLRDGEHIYRTGRHEPDQPVFNNLPGSANYARNWAGLQAFAGGYFDSCAGLAQHPCFAR